MKSAILATSLIALFTTAIIQNAYAQENGKFSLETGMGYTTGKYGGTQSTNILYVPVVGKYEIKSWTLKLTVPYLRVSGPRNVINGVGVAGAATPAVTTRSGLGDVIAAATHNFYNGGSSGLLIDLTGKIKFGTASSTQGLGTGKNDYAFQVDLYQTTGDHTNFGNVGYKIYSSPVGYKLNNVFYGSLGGSYKFNQETSGGMMVNFSQKVTAKGSSHIQAIFFASHKLDKNLKAQGYVLKGFTNSVPSWGVAATVAYLF
jgi:hypothetical protein